MSHVPLNVSQHSPKPSLSAAAPCIARSQEDARWFEEEVYAHGGQLRSYLRGSFPGVHDVEDVVQESYLRVWKAKATKSIISAKAFLFQVARNVATDVVRRAQASPVRGVTDLGALSVLDTKPNAAESTCTREEIALLADAIDSLPRRCREIFVLRKLIRVPQKEIAATLGLSEQTVQVQVLRGMKRCEVFLLRHGL